MGHLPFHFPEEKVSTESKRRADPYMTVFTFTVPERLTLLRALYEFERRRAHYGHHLGDVKMLGVAPIFTVGIEQPLRFE